MYIYLYDISLQCPTVIACTATFALTDNTGGHFSYPRESMLSALRGSPNKTK